MRCYIILFLFFSDKTKVIKQIKKQKRSDKHIKRRFGQGIHKLEETRKSREPDLFEFLSASSNFVVVLVLSLQAFVSYKKRVYCNWILLVLQQSKAICSDYKLLFYRIANNMHEQ